jgi:cytochrome c biogenesis protein CcmG, thiol:disulfide interchange protein DsbE
VRNATTVTLPSGDGVIVNEEPTGAQPTSSSNPHDSGEGGLATRRRELRRLMIGSAMATVVVLAAVVLLKLTDKTGTGQSASPAVGTGTVAPNFTLPNLLSSAAQPLPDVNLYDLGKDRHHAVVLNFYASWCPPCRAETPLLASAARSAAVRSPSVQFVGVDVADLTSGALRFTKQAGVAYPVGADRDFEVASHFGLNTEPHTYFINDDGVVIGQVSGQLSASSLHSWLQRLHATG